MQGGGLRVVCLGAMQLPLMSIEITWLHLNSDGLVQETLPEYVTVCVLSFIPLYHERNRLTAHNAITFTQ